MVGVPAPVQQHARPHLPDDVLEVGREERGIERHAARLRPTGRSVDVPRLTVAGPRPRAPSAMVLDDFEIERLRAIYRLDAIEVIDTSAGGVTVRVRRGEHVEERELGVDELADAESVREAEVGAVRELAGRFTRAA